MSTVRAPRLEPVRSRSDELRADLRVVEEVDQRRYPSPGKVGSVIGAVVFVVLFALAGLHVVLVNGQAGIDDLNDRIAVEKSRQTDLTLSVAELKSPERINEVARDRMGMIQPGVIAFLTPDPQDDSRAVLDESADAPSGARGK